MAKWISIGVNDDDDDDGDDDDVGELCEWTAIFWLCKNVEMFATKRTTTLPDKNYYNWQFSFVIQYREKNNLKFPFLS